MKGFTGIFFFSFKTLLVGLVVVLLVMTFSPPPERIDFPHPHAKGKSSVLTDDFWKAFQTGSTWAVGDSECGTNHGWPDDTKPPQYEVTYSQKNHRFANILCRMESALEENPDDEVLANILAAAYSWRAATKVRPEHSLRDLYEARYHAGQSMKLGNRFAGGFEAAPSWYIGFILQGQGEPEEKYMKYKTSAYKQMIDDTLEFASFHGYVEGVMLSAMLNPEMPEPEFEYSWANISFLQNIEACFWGENKLLRKIHFPGDLRINDLMMNVVARISILSGRGYCYNNETSPFNMPGLYLAQGDAYLKAGNIEYAKVAYENALRSPGAARWDYADQVRIRLNDMGGMRRKFLNDSFKFDVEQLPSAIVGQSTWFCAGCHQWSGPEKAALLAKSIEQ